MQRDIQAFGRVTKEGVLKIVHRKLFDEELKLLAGKNVDITITPARAIRTTQQNRLWWLYMKILGNELGYTKDEIHKVCKALFLRFERVVAKLNDTGQRVMLDHHFTDEDEYRDVFDDTVYLREEFEILETVDVTGSTAKLPKDKFAELVDKLRAWSQGVLNIYLPLPEEQTTMDV